MSPALRIDPTPCFLAFDLTSERPKLGLRALCVEAVLAAVAAWWLEGLPALRLLAALGMATVMVSGWVAKRRHPQFEMVAVFREMCIHSASPRVW